MGDETSLRASVFIATSLDGFIARENGDIDWLSVADDGNEARGEDYGYAAFFDTVDVMVMGRGTFEKVLTFGEWPYGSKRVVVLSSRQLDIPDHLSDTVDATTSAPDELARQLAEDGHRHAYIDGGQTIQSFLAAGLLDRLIITRIPVLLGSGRPLFGRLPADVRLRHVRTTDYATGLVQSEYEVVGKR
jgi:dihydrofolate reductase